MVVETDEGCTPGIGQQIMVTEIPQECYRPGELGAEGSGGDKAFVDRCPLLIITYARDIMLSWKTFKKS